jgi:DNA polymerase-1
MLDEFKEIWMHDFEFHAPDGERPLVATLGAKELRSGRVVGLSFGKDGLDLRDPPYDTGPENLFVSFYASAEVGAHLALGWPAPANVLDLFCEFRNLTNETRLKGEERPKNNLLAALKHFGLSAMDAEEKDDMRAIAMRGPPWSGDELAALVAYALEDVAALERLLPTMLPRVSIPHALLRGRYMCSVAAMEREGVPIDTEKLQLLRGRWDNIKTDLITKMDRAFGCFEGTTFKRDRFEALLVARDIPWPRHPTGTLDLEEDTFRQMAKSYPEIAPLHELRSSLSKLRLNKLAVGSDGNNRCLLSPFSSMTGRNQPSSVKFIFGPHTWIRGLIQPKPGDALAYIDYCQQEFGIAAALSGDPAMLGAYRSGDPYLAFAKQVGVVPADATKATHGPQRELAKQCILAVQYGMGSKALADRVGECPARGAELLRLHEQAYPKYWKWSRAAVDHAMFKGSLHTALGWQVNVRTDANPRSLANFPMQGNGAEILRLACCLGVERGIRIAAPVHDAVLVSAPIDTIDDVVSAMRQTMTEAASQVLGGFELSTDEKATTHHPDRYMDERGGEMWKEVLRLADPSLVVVAQNPRAAFSAVDS